MADSNQRHRLFDAVALAWVSNWRSMPDLKATIIEAVGDVEGELESEESLLSEWRGVVSTLSESEVRRVRDYSRQLADDLERRLRESESELDRATRQIRFLQGENQSKRISAELELTRDAITVLGIALQDLATFSTPKSQEIADIESKITLALSVLGTRPFGEIGEIAFSLILSSTRLHRCPQGECSLGLWPLV